jgi:hypothetical protein
MNVTSLGAIPPLYYLLKTTSNTNMATTQTSEFGVMLGPVSH